MRALVLVLLALALTGAGGVAAADARPPSGGDRATACPQTSGARALARLALAGNVLLGVGCVAANPGGEWTAAPASLREERQAEADLVRTLRAFVDSGPFSRERAERMLGMRFALGTGPLTSPQLLGLAETNRPFVVPSCSGGYAGEFRTGFTQYLDGEPLELTVAYSRSVEAAAEPADAVLHREFRAPWSCTVGVQQVGPHSAIDMAAYVWRTSDSILTVRKEIGVACAALRVARHPSTWQPPLPLRSLSCEEFPGLSKGGNRSLRVQCPVPTSDRATLCVVQTFTDGSRLGHLSVSTRAPASLADIQSRALSLIHSPQVSRSLALGRIGKFLHVAVSAFSGR